MKDRKEVFSAFHDRLAVEGEDGKLKRPEWGPEFIDSLVNTMRHSRCLTERVCAWHRWRGWCNSSEYAVSDWNPEFARSLNQLDCALDLWWFSQGKTVKWVEGATEKVRDEERKTPAIQKLKSPISRAFAKAQARGSLIVEGQRIRGAVSPQPDGEKPKVAYNSNFRKDATFMAWWKIAEIDNFQECECAYNSYLRAQKVGRNSYRRYLEQATSHVPILIDSNLQSINSNTEVAAAAAVFGASEAPPPLPLRVNNSSSGGGGGTAAVPAREPEPAAESIAPLLEAIEPIGAVSDATAHQILRECRKDAPEVTVKQVAARVPEVHFSPNVKSRVAVLKAELPALFRGEALAQWRKQRTRSPDPRTLTNRETVAWYQWGRAETAVERAEVRSSYPDIKFEEDG